MSNLAHYPAVARIDLSALERNAKRMQTFAPNVRHMGIVKAEAYGHGRDETARALVRAGYDVLGVAQLGEALELSTFLRKEGLSPRIFSWILPTQDDEAIQHALQEGIELSVSNLSQLQLIEQQGVRARIHLEAETGMGRGGALPSDFEKLALAARRSTSLEVVGVWSHLARADEQDSEGQKATALQIELFERAVSIAQGAQLGQFERHLAATSGQIWHADSHFDMVRDGIGLYGLSPNPKHETTQNLGLEPVMTLQSELAQVKRVPAGQTVSYGGTWSAPTERWLGLVPLGYADGIPRHASGGGPVAIYSNGKRIDTHVVGRVCMDQFMIDLGPASDAVPPAKAGDLAVLFGNPKSALTPGCPLADDWALVCNTINYEIVTRLGERVPRAYAK